MGILYDKPGRMAVRVGCVLPLTPWFVAIHYLVQPNYALGKHSANALYSVASQLLNVNLGFSAVALVAILGGDADKGIKKFAAGFVILHFFFFGYFLLTNAIAYV